MTSPVFFCTKASKPSALSRSQMGALMRLCHTMALATGLPVARSHRIVVSRWLVTPMAAMSAAVAPAFLITARATANCESQIDSGSCSTMPGAGNICGNSRWAAAAGRPS